MQLVRYLSYYSRKPLRPAKVLEFGCGLPPARGATAVCAALALLVAGCDSDSAPAGTDAQHDGKVIQDSGVDGPVADLSADAAPIADGPPADAAQPDAARDVGPALDVPLSLDLPLPPSDAALADVVVFDAAPPPPGCGNGVREGAEECDDGNTTNLDGCSSSCQFEQVHRINYLLLEGGTDAAFCGQNAFGGAITNQLALDQIQGALDGGIKDGSMSILMQFLALDDLTGQNDPLLVLGLLAGSPVSGAGYHGASDLDWWYTVETSGLDASRVPLVQLNGSIVAGTLQAGPGTLSLPLDLGGALSVLKISHARMTADVGAASQPLAASGATPGHLPGENLDPALTSFASMGSHAVTSQGKLCGNVSAASLAAVPMPDALTGLVSCQEGYSAQSSLLDLIVGGCTVMLLGQIIAPTQPDTHDPTAAPAGAGPRYTLALDANKRVASCKDKDGQAVDLAACLQDAAYSVFFRFATGRVIGR